MRLQRCAVVMALGSALLGGVAVGAPKTRDARAKVALDVGHDDRAPGALSAIGRREVVYNRELAGVVEQALRDRGLDIVRVEAPRGKAMSLRGRVNAARAAGATLFLSIHHDSVQPHYLIEGGGHPHCERFRGHALFVSRLNADPAASERLGRAVGTSLLDAGFSPTLHHAEPIEGENRPLLDASLGLHAFDRLFVVRTFPGPALLVEGGVLVNREEEPELRDDARRQRFARALAAGVARFLSEVLPSPRSSAVP